jgi:hypothetical protein
MTKTEARETVLGTPEGDLDSKARPASTDTGPQRRLDY